MSVQDSKQTCPVPLAICPHSYPLGTLGRIPLVCYLDLGDLASKEQRARVGYGVGTEMWCWDLPWCRSTWSSIPLHSPSSASSGCGDCLTLRNRLGGGRRLRGLSTRRARACWPTSSCRPVSSPSELGGGGGGPWPLPPWSSSARSSSSRPLSSFLTLLLPRLGVSSRGPGKTPSAAARARVSLTLPSACAIRASINVKLNLERKKEVGTQKMKSKTL